MLRAAAHLLVWFPFVFAAARSIANGWRPVSDNAEIALRSWNVLTAHAPLVGQATRLTGGVYDPGPLQYWLVTVPVHIDPQHGVLWGSALWCMAAGSLAIEAAWSVAGALGGLLATATILGALAWIPEITLLPCWNPWFGMMFFLATLAVGWATLTGRRGWWPVLVITGSIAAQAHLMFTITAIVLILLGLGFGLADTFREKGGYTWAVTGLVAGLACWSAPLIQQFTARTGNLTALVSGKATPGPPAGLSFGLKALAASAQPPPFWWTPLRSLVELGVTDQRSVVAGAVVLALAVAVLAVALYPLRSRPAAALAAVSLTVAAGALITYSHIPRASLSAAVFTTTDVADNLRYLMAPMFPVGVLAWLAAGTVLVLAARPAVRRLRSRDAARENDTAAGDDTGPGDDTAPEDGTAPGALRDRAARWAVPAVGVAVVGIIALTSLAGAEIAGEPISQSLSMRAVNAASQQIEHAVPHRRIALSVTAPDYRIRRQVTFGLVYALSAVGYRPQVGTQWALQLGSVYGWHGKPMTHVSVLLQGGGLWVDVTKGPPGKTAHGISPSTCAGAC
jgi:hypothetical protein